MHMTENEKIQSCRHCGRGPAIQAVHEETTSLLNKLDPGSMSGMTTKARDPEINSGWSLSYNGKHAFTHSSSSRSVSMRDIKNNCRAESSLLSTSVVAWKQRGPEQQHLRTTRRGAFTLIELLVVVLIIGILAAIALPQYQQAVLKTRYAELKVLTAALVEAQEIYYMANGVYSQSFDELDINTPAYISEEDDINANNINRPKRRFTNNKSCTLWEISVSCKLPGIAFGRSYAHAGSEHRDQCIAYNVDLSSKENKLCKNETGNQTPGETGDTYLRWYY